MTDQDQIKQLKQDNKRLKEIISVSQCILCSNSGKLQKEKETDPDVECSFCKTKEELL